MTNQKPEKDMTINPGMLPFDRFRYSAWRSSGQARPRPPWPGLIPAALLVFTSLVPVQGDPLPVTGCGAVPLAPLDAEITGFMDEHGITAANFALMKEGVIVMERGYGWQDEAQTMPLAADAVMRTASLTKLYIASAVRRLVEEGALALTDYAFDLGQPGGGILDHEPFPALGDPRLADITIDDLLHHRGGWDKSVSGDHTYRDIEIANDLGIPSPPARDDTLRWILGQPLDFDPGSAGVYANTGYFVLGLVIEAASGLPVVDYIREAVLAPIGVPGTEIGLVRTQPAFRDPREPWYDSSIYVCDDVFDPLGPLVPCADGGRYYEGAVASGGVLSSARALTTWLEHYEIGYDFGTPRDHASEGNEWTWVYYGSMWGNTTIARQRGPAFGKVNWTLMFNLREDAGEERFFELIRPRMDAVVAAIERWPRTPACESPSAPPDPASAPLPADGSVDLALAVTLDWTAGMDSETSAVYLGTDPVLGPEQLVATTADTFLDAGTLNPGTTYYWRVDEVNAAGAQPGAVWSFTTVAQAGWTELSRDDFESGWGSYVDGGSDARRSSRDSGYAHGGIYCARIRDNSGTSSSIYSSSGLDVTGYSEIDVDFWFQAISMEPGEDFLVEFFDGSTWQVVRSFVSGVDFTNGVFVHVTDLVIDSENHTFSTGMKLRFRCDAGQNSDRIYLDDIVVSAR